MEYLFKGVATALYSPMKKGEIDFEQFEKLIDRQVKAKVDALVFLGTTGESATITHFERESIIKFAVSKLKGKIPIIIGTGTNDTKTTCLLTQNAKSLGADGVLVVTPYYIKPEQEGILYHYEQISKCCKMPFIVYNVPKRTGVSILPTTLKSICKSDYFCGVKEADINVKNVQMTYDALDKSCPVYCGSDELTSFHLLNNCFGTISVASNVIPCKIKEFICDFKTNYEKHNNDYNTFFKDFFALLSSKTNPIPIKLLGKYLYGEDCSFRSPLIMPNNDYLEYFKQQLNELIQRLKNGRETLC